MQSVPMPIQPSTIPAIAIPLPPWAPFELLIWDLLTYPKTSARIEPIHQIQTIDRKAHV